MLTTFEETTVHMEGILSNPSFQLLFGDMWSYVEHKIKTSGYYETTVNEEMIRDAVSSFFEDVDISDDIKYRIDRLMSLVTGISFSIVFVKHKPDSVITDASAKFDYNSYLFEYLTLVCPDKVVSEHCSDFHIGDWHDKKQKGSEILFERGGNDNINPARCAITVYDRATNRMMLSIGDNLFTVDVTSFVDEPFAMKLVLKRADGKETHIVSTMYGYNDEKTSVFSRGSIFVSSCRDYDWEHIFESAGLLETIVHNRFGLNECLFNLDALHSYCPKGVEVYEREWEQAYSRLDTNTRKSLNNVPIGEDKSPVLRNIATVKVLPKADYIAVVGVSSQNITGVASKTGFVNLYVPVCDVYENDDDYDVVLHADAYYVGYVDVNNTRQSAIVSAQQIADTFAVKN